jgi:predicted Zn-dependent protease
LVDGPIRLDWAGVYLDGRTAARQPATIRLTRTALEVTVEGSGSRLWPYGEFRQTQGAHPGEPVRLERGDELPEAVVIVDRHFLHSLVAVAGPDAPRSSGQRRIAIVAGAVIASAVIIVALYLWVIPELARTAATLVPVAWEERLGAAVVERLVHGQRRCGDVAGQDALDSLLRRLAGTERSSYRFRVVVVDDDDLNAYAAPGGHVVVLRGLIARSQTADELAGVLAHEAQHVVRRHATRATLERASTGLLVAALFGDVSGIIAFAADTATTLGYSRLHEDEADREGLGMLVRARIDPAGMIRFYDEVLAAEVRLPRSVQYVSTHPPTADRVTRLRALAASQSHAETVPALTGDQWNAVRAICDRP